MERRHSRTHNSRKGDQACLLREGGSDLFPEKFALLDGGSSDIINPLLRHGLALERLEEYYYANGWNGIKDMRPTDSAACFPRASPSRC